MSSSSLAASTASVSSIAFTFVDDIYAQVMGRERHGCVRRYEYDVILILVFGSSSTGQLRSTLSTQLEKCPRDAVPVQLNLYPYTLRGFCPKMRDFAFLTHFFIYQSSPIRPISKTDHGIPSKQLQKWFRLNENFFLSS